MSYTILRKGFVNERQYVTSISALENSVFYASRTFTEIQVNKYLLRDMQ